MREKPELHLKTAWDQEQTNKTKQTDTHMGEKLWPRYPPISYSTIEKINK